MNDIDTAYHPATGAIPSFIKVALQLVLALHERGFRGRDFAACESQIER